MPGERLFPLLSRVPFTPEWRLYRDVNRWIADAHRVVLEVIPGAPDPVPTPRNRDAMLVAVDAMEAILIGLERHLAGVSIEEAWAVTAEMFPV